MPEMAVEQEMVLILICQLLNYKIKCRDIGKNAEVANNATSQSQKKSYKC